MSVPSGHPDPYRKPWQKPYNGFNWAERCAIIPMQNAAIRERRLIRPTVCCICGDDRSERPQARDYRFLHAEDYRRPLDIYQLCKADHAALHASAIYYIQNGQYLSDDVRQANQLRYSALPIRVAG